MANWLQKVQMLAKALDGQGQWLMPTMVDLCARLREPGQQQHGTLKSEGKAARENGILHCIYPTRFKTDRARQWCFNSWSGRKSHAGWWHLFSK